MAKRRCVFCGSDKDMSKEDALPQWVLAKLLAHDGALRLSVTGGRSYSPDRFHHRPASGRDVLGRQVCRPCNQGWMSDLEVAAQPYLGTMMSGYAVAFPRPARSTIAAWATKTAMMLLYSLSPPLSPHPSLLAHMYEHHTVPRPVRVWLASYKSAVPIPGQFVAHFPAYARLDHTAGGSVINPAVLLLPR